MVSLENLRQTVDDLDEKIVQLLNERAEAARAIGREKQRRDLPVRDDEREADVLRRIERLSEGPLTGEQLSRVYSMLMQVCSELQDGDREAVPERHGGGV
jgi:chorismate mutase